MTTDLQPISEIDRERILATARDYIESWLHGDPDRMARALHPELVKRRVQPDGPAAGTLIGTTRDEMVAATAEGVGTRLARPYEASIMDAYGDIASVRVLSAAYMDHLHVARFGSEWKIVNVLWQRRPIPPA